MQQWTGLMAMWFVLGFAFANTCSGAVIVRAARAISPPVLDGKLTDPCWADAKPVTGFKQYNSKNPARYQSTGYVVFNDIYLYIGMRCEEPRPENIKSRQRPHDGSVFADDVVEIMLDPGASRVNYFQFAVNASGSTFDCSRTAGGASEDDEWNSDMQAGAFVGDGYWSVELAVPYYSLGITPKTGATWGINLCREKPNPSELSTIAEDGIFNNARTFAKLTGLDVAFRDYCVLIGAPRIRGVVGKQGLAAETRVAVRNETGKLRQLKVQQQIFDEHGAAATRSDDLTLKNRQESLLELATLRLKPLTSGKTDTFVLLPSPRTQRLVISDAGTGKILKTCNLQYPARLRVLEVRVHQPHSGEKTPVVIAEGNLGIELIAALSDATADEGVFAFTILDESGSKVFESSRIRALGAHEIIAFSPENLPTGRLTVHYSFHLHASDLVLDTHHSFVNVPGARDSVRVLNNMVSELLKVQPRSSGAYFDFVNPRDGWVFFASMVDLSFHSKTIASIHLCHKGSEQTIIVHRPDNSPTQEAMRWLRAGDYALKIDPAQAAAIKSLIVRAIPELIYCKFGSNPQVSFHGKFDWEFLRKHVLPNVNCIVGTGSDGEKPYAKQWKEQGKKWIVECPLPGLAADTITTEEAYKAWSDNPGYADPCFDGIIVDEFTGGDIHKYAAWTEALRRLTTNPTFLGKSFYPYCGAIYGADASRTFVETVIGAESRFAWQQYLKEQPSKRSAVMFLNASLRQGMLEWRRAIADAAQYAIVCFGYLCAPPESLNTNPNVDYKVWKDMQYNLLAKDPAFRNLYGVMEYTASYADEEALRWQGRLYRHYCIEGKKTMLSKELGFRYKLTHLTNPDFNEGAKGWAVAPAEPGSIAPGRMDGFGWLEGRYPRTNEGDNFLVMRRSPVRPNFISQNIRNLKPGRLYSLKMFTADLGELRAGKSSPQKHAVSIYLDNVEKIPDNCFQQVIAHCYAHDLAPFNANNRAWMNYHWVVFRPNAKTAKLTISDWLSPTEPGGPSGQELIMNFIEVQPYLKD